MLVSEFKEKYPNSQRGDKIVVKVIKELVGAAAEQFPGLVLGEEHTVDVALAGHFISFSINGRYCYAGDLEQDDVMDNLFEFVRIV